MKKIFLSLFLQSSLVYGDMESERSATYFRDQLEVSQVAETPTVNSEKLQEEFLEHKELYAKFFILNPDPKTSHDKKWNEIKQKLLKNHEIFEDFLKGPIGIKELEEGEEHTIVSLTSWPPRIHTVFLTIESILRQTHKPHKVVLYLAKDEFYENTDLPETLKFQQTRGLEVRWVKENLRSYKKLLYALKEFPESNIITVDDDHIYKKTLLDEFLKEHAKDKETVIGGATILIDKNIENAFIMAIGAFGILYPPRSFMDNVFDTETIKKINPIGDDEWFASAATANGKIFLETNFTKSPSFLRIRRLSEEYLKEISPGLKLVYLLKHYCMEYFNLYEKLNIKPNPKVLEYLESKKKK